MLGKKDEALEWAKIAKAAIGVEDKSWDERIKVLSSKRIALYRPGALGDVIMTLNLIGPIKKKYPEYYIDYYCSKEIGDSIGYLMKQAGIDEIYEYGGLPHSSYEREIRLVGYPLNEGYPYTKMRKHLLEYFGDEAGVTVDPNLCMLLPKPEALVSGKYITIHATAGWSKYKNWDIANWEKIVKHYPDIVFYQIGSANDPKIEGAIHTYMGTEIKNSINLIANAQFHLGVDSFTNHLSHIVWTDSEGYNKHTSAIILWGSTQWDAAGYLHNCNISLNLECQPCFREDLTISTARTDPCPNNHKCMQMISVDRVVIEIDKYLKNIDQMALLNVLT
jgi:ADP-heptose:LPS heptosyltransferase